MYVTYLCYYKFTIRRHFFLFHTVYKQKRLPYYRATFFKHNNQFSSELKQLDYLLIVV